MNESISKNATTALLKNRKFYGVIVAPDGQRFRFDISAIFQKMIEESSEKFLSGAAANFNRGQEMYEEAEREENPFPVTEQFLQLHKNAAESGKSSAVFYLAHEICREALDSLEIIIYTKDSKEEWHEAHSSLVKQGRKYDEERKQDRQINKECAEYWRGYDEARAEMAEEREKRRAENSKKGFWNKLRESFQND